MTFDGPDERAKGCILSNPDMSVAKRRQGDGSVVIWTVIVEQTLIRQNKIDDSIEQGHQFGFYGEEFLYML